VRSHFVHARITPAVIARLEETYPTLRIEADETGSSIHAHTSTLSPEHVHRLTLDVEFFERNPRLPLENLCSHLDTYVPRTPSQTEMLDYAKRLAALRDESVGAGLYMWGEAGIGKSHISVGLAKDFMERGLEPIFMTAETYSFDTQLRLEPGQVWIIDDMNSGYGISSRLYKKVILNIHDRGGRVFVTSNKPYDDLMREMFVGDGDAERMRYEDRTKGMFKILHVVGASYRQEQAWYHRDQKDTDKE
jgi:DNA replication protein DnaC